MNKILGPMRRTIQDYHMIKAGDRIAVGLSGGKDSMALLYALWRYQHFSDAPFELEAITLDLGFPDMDFSEVAAFCRDLNIPYTIEKSLIGNIVFEERQEKNPCALCARMRRGALHDLALRRGCRKIAFGHHADDVIETFFLSLFYEGRINTFSPVTYLDRKDITLIRPFALIKEKDIVGEKEVAGLPVVKSTCPADSHTKREEVKRMIVELRKDIDHLDDRVLRAIRNKDQFHLWF